MGSKARRKTPEVVYRDGKPTAVTQSSVLCWVIDIDDYQDMLERLEDVDDLKMLAELRRKPLKFRKLAEFLEAYQPDV